MPELAEFFNAGSDARLAGVPLADNPYPPQGDSRYSYWRMGWIDVEKHWGEWARWPVVKLPPVEELP